MPKIRLRPNVSYDWLGQRRVGGETYQMGEPEAEYVRASGFEFDPDEVPPAPTVEPGRPTPKGRFAALIARALEEAEAEEK